MIRRNAMSSNHPHVLLSGGLSGWRKIGGVAALAMMGLLGGCAREPVIPVPVRHAEDARLVPPDRVVVLSDGARIPLRVWPAVGKEKGVILALHGFNDSRDAWEIPAPRFSAQGYTLVAPDLRGFGRAPDRSHWAGTARMVRDVQEELTLLHIEHPGVPVWMMGESMGGAVAMLAATDAATPPMAGVILLAPAVWHVGPGVDFPLRLMAAIAPEARVSGRELPVHVVASNNIAALRRLYYDPLTLHTTRLVALRGLMDLMNRAAASAGQQVKPTLLVYGDRDQLVPEREMMPVWERLPTSVRRDVIPGGHHLLLRERDGAQVADDILAWMKDADAPLPSGGDVAAGTWTALHGEELVYPEPLAILPAQMDWLTP
ncbi:alpha/beta fold hydrolase [Acetobacter estunensis]|uniref:Alpha/beta fold hydrolase n=2 Tax=Acetobacter estunensis TaxID=104097 RepID=A0A967ECY8_9PROT|nr:alpha/beta fold hydrolase [Acetobacter estunensis]